MRNAVIFAFCTLVAASPLAAAQNPVSSPATISASKSVLADLPNGQQPAGTKGVVVTGSYDCGFGKVAAAGQPDMPEKIQITVFDVTQLNPRVLTLTWVDEEEIRPNAVRTAAYNSKRFNLPVTAANGQPAKYRIDVLLYISGQQIIAATTFIPEFTL